jgi:hypothetical protein
MIAATSPVENGSTSFDLMLRADLMRVATFSPHHLRSRQNPQNWRSNSSSFMLVMDLSARPARNASR